MWYLKRLISPYVAPACLIFFFFLGPCALASDERSLSFYQTHTGERLTVTYKVGDDYVPAAMEKINYILRDHRTGEVHPMDPKLLDFLYDVLTAVNNHGAVHIISGYRSPKTNQMLRGRGERGVAKGSMHKQGKALDFRLPGTETKKLRDAALAMKRGGVGYYPDSDFVQIDTGRVRFW